MRVKFYIVIIFNNYLLRLLIYLSFQRCEIIDCGVFGSEDDLGITDNDGTLDIYPQFPEDSEINFDDDQVNLK